MHLRGYDLSPVEVALKYDPNEEGVARDWSLTSAGQTLIAECRRPDHRQRFALRPGMPRARPLP
jgi:hypothetical protein